MERGKRAGGEAEVALEELGRIVENGLGSAAVKDLSRPIVFKSLGLAVQDLVAAKMVCQKVNLAVEKEEEGNSVFPAKFWGGGQVKAARGGGGGGGRVLSSKATSVDGDGWRLSVSASLVDGGEAGGEGDFVVFTAVTVSSEGERRIGGGVGIVLDAADGSLLGVGEHDGGGGGDSAGKHGDFASALGNLAKIERD